jgi:hypothetical protein
MEGEHEARVSLREGWELGLPGPLEVRPRLGRKFVHEEADQVHPPIHDAQLHHVAGGHREPGGQDPRTVPLAAQEDVVDRRAVVEPESLS